MDACTGPDGRRDLAQRDPEGPVFLEVAGLDRFSALECETRHSFARRHPTNDLDHLERNVHCPSEAQTAIATDVYRSRNAASVNQKGRQPGLDRTDSIRHDLLVD
jgi:hypothetical protein